MLPSRRFPLSSWRRIVSFPLSSFASAELTAFYWFVDTLPDLIANGTTFSDWLYVRETANHYSNGPVRNVFPNML